MSIQKALGSLSLLLLLLPAISHGDEFWRGWCEGYNRAAQAARWNRDHWRHVIGLPKLSSEEVLADAYAAWPPSQCKMQTNDVGKTLCLAGVSVDLYILPALHTEPITILMNYGLLYAGIYVECPSGTVMPGPGEKKE
jgi:hypothetical protein